MSDSDLTEVSCPFDGCDWSWENTHIDEDIHGEEYAHLHAERHFEREHCGKARVRVVVEKEVSLHPGDDLQSIIDRQYDRIDERDEPVGFDTAWAFGEVLEPAEDADD